MNDASLSHAIQEVVAADDARIRAVLDRDRMSLQEILSDELVYTHSSGSQEDKTLYIQRVIEGVYDYRAFVQKSRHFRIAAGLVFMHGDNEVDIVREARLHQLAGRYLMVWGQESGRWRLFSFWAAPIPRH